MALDKIVNNGINIAQQNVQKQGQKPVQMITNVINPAKLTGLDALGAYNSAVIKKQNPKWILENEQLQKIKEKLNTILDNLPDDKTLSYAVSNVLKADINSKRLLRELNGIGIVFEKLQEMTPKQREKIFNSKFLETIMNTSQNQGFRFSCLDIPMDKIDKLDDLTNNKLTCSYLTKLIKNNDKGFNTTDLVELIPEIEESASRISSFANKKNTDKLCNLLTQRNYQDIPQLCTILQSKLEELPDKKINEFYSIVETLLNAKTPTNEFIFGFSNSSDRTKKMFLSGIENILNLKSSNQEEYLKLMNLLELTKQGKVPPSVLGVLAKEGRINKEFLSIVSRMQEGIPFISKFENQTEALNKSTLGDVVQIGQDLFYRQDNSLDKLNLSKETFEELFPPVETFALSQGELGDCYLVSAIFDFIKNPKTRGKLYQMFSSSGDDIIVTIPDAKEFPITFSNKLLKKDEKKNINASMGIQILEDAYRQTRALKYGTANKMTMLEGGEQANVYSAFLNKKNVLHYELLDENLKKPTKEEMQKELEEIRKHLADLKKDYKGISKKENMTLVDKVSYAVDHQTLESINKNEALERSMQELMDNLDNYHDIKEDKLVEKLIEFAHNKNNLVSIGTKQGGIFDKDKLIYGQHAYSVLGVDTVNKTVDVVNPWNSAQYTTLSFDEFKKYFSAIQTVEI